MDIFQKVCFCILICFFLYFFIIRPIIAIGDLPGCIDRLTREVEELKEVLKNNGK